MRIRFILVIVCACPVLTNGHRTDDIVGPNMSAFITKYRGVMSARRGAGDSIRGTRVALIDSGVVVVSAKRSKKGAVHGIA